jgi:superfamily I DNA and/or RNA helicase
VGFIGDQLLQGLEYDLCIIDEASKATSTELLVPIVRSKKIVLVGDDNQLSPNENDILRRKDLLAKYKLNPMDVQQTLFEHFLVGLPDSSIASLNIQYRMDPPIGNLISKCFYEGQIINGTQNTPSEIISLLDKQIKWFDTSAKGRKSFELQDGHSYVNELEKSEIIYELEQLWLKISTEEEHRTLRKSSFLIISPYASQVSNIRRGLDMSLHLRQPLVDGQIRVLTIDSVQGLEADFTFFSVTRSNDKRNAREALGFISGEYWKRHNVALSRAKHGLFIFGNTEFISKWSGLGEPLDFIKDNPDTAEIVPVRSRN